MTTDQASKVTEEREPSGASLRRLLRSSLRAVETSVNGVVDAPGSGGAVKRKRRVEAVHGLRVATRRAGAIVEIIAPLLAPKRAAATSRRLKRLRSAGGLVRDCDVQRRLLGDLAGECDAAERSIVAAVRESIEAERTFAWRVLTRTAERCGDGALKRRHKRLVASLDQHAPGDAEIHQTVRAGIDALRELVQRAASADLGAIENVHALRISCKRLRYGIEAMRPWLNGPDLQNCLSHLGDVQAELGRFNDSHQTLRRIEAFAAARVQRHEDEPSAGSARDDDRVSDLAALQALVDRLRLRVDRDQETAVQTWRTAVAAGLLSAVVTTGGAGDAAPVAAPDTTAPPVAPAAGVVVVVASGRERSASRGTRIAAIDIGSNSTRLIIAEVAVGGSPGSLSGASPDADLSYRVLDDERELTRLGKGLDATGELNGESLQHAVAAIKRMKGIAEGYGVERIRVVATAAVREARNGQVFVDEVRRQAGLEVEVISAEQEAMLSYRSASRAFDLGVAPAIVVDVGGGSTEVVLSVPAAMRRQGQASPAAPQVAAGGAHPANGNGDAPRGSEPKLHEPSVGGVIERVYKIPLGAVRLTERFGGAEACSKGRFDEMRRAIKRRFTQIIGQPPVVPLVLIGTGGTFSALGSMCAAGELGPAASGLFAGAVQGYEVKRPQVMHQLDLIRKMPLKERTKVPGLASDRTDIIVAGLALVDRLMKHFGVNHIRIHDGGVRDGVLLAMAQEIQAASSTGKPVRRDPLRSVKRFARACGYEQAHSRHVARLCLRVFDQLAKEFRDPVIEDDGTPSRAMDESQHQPGAPGPEGSQKLSRARKRAGLFSPENRILLEAAALLHDVGYLINYSSHHKHSYHLIMHAELPGFTRRDVEVIANVGRYHRLSEPKMNHRNFAQLAKPERRLVRVLAGILRVCDGLDRTHTQCVEGIDMTFDHRRSRAILGIRSATEPGVDIWGAQRKSGLFARALRLEPVLEWRPPKAPAASPGAAAADPSGASAGPGVVQAGGGVTAAAAR